MNIVTVLDSLDKQSGGPVRSALGLIRSLDDMGHSIALVTRRAAEAKAEREEIGRAGVRISYLPRMNVCLVALGRAANGGRQLAEVAATADVFHLNGVWPTIYKVGNKCARRRGIPLVVSTRGMFQPHALAYSSTKKRVARWLYIDADLRRAQILHATSDQEAQVLRENGFTNPVAIVANGIHTSNLNLSEPLPEKSQGWPCPNGKRMVLFLSRIHPIKGVDDLITAWAKLTERLAEWHLVLAGPGTPDYVGHIDRSIAESNISKNVSLLGPIYGEQKRELFRRCQFLVLPSYSENFGNVVAEALACGKPVITTKGTPWKELETHKCGWWIDVGVKPLEAALREAMGLSDEQRQEMGLRGRKLAEENYSWPKIAAQMLEVYQWCINGGAPPSCVMLD